MSVSASMSTISSRSRNGKPRPDDRTRRRAPSGRRHPAGRGAARRRGGRSRGRRARRPRCRCGTRPSSNSRAVLGEVPEDLLDEERVPLGLAEDRVDHHLGRRPARRGPRSSRPRSRGRSRLTGSRSSWRARTSRSSARRERSRARRARRRGTCRRPSTRRFGHQRGHVLDQQQRRFVGPVDVVHHEQQREARRSSGNERPDCVEEVPALLLRGQIERLGDVGEPAPQLGHHARDLGSVVAHVLADDVGRHDRQRLLQHLHERRVRDACPPTRSTARTPRGRPAARPRG